MERKYIFVINPGSTTTKVGLFEGTEEIFTHKIDHPAEEVEKYEKITDQYDMRTNYILQALRDKNVNIQEIAAVVGRGGLLKPIPSGVYRVNEAMKSDLKNSPMGEHASNLGGLIADALAKSISPEVPAFIADPVVVDELEPLARYSGHPEFPRISIFHALNQKAVAYRYARENNTTYEEKVLIVAHMGGGISIGLHKYGKVVDVNNALDGDGPFSPERSGSLPVGALAKACFSGKYSHSDIKKMIKGKGGLVAYLGTNNTKEVEDDIIPSGKIPAAAEIYESMAYQVAKEIGSLATVNCGKIDAIILTGGVARGEEFVKYIADRVSFIAPVVSYPGEDELEALCEAGYRAIKNKVKIREYL